MLALDLLLAVAGAYLLMFITLLFFQDTIADHTSTFFQPIPLRRKQQRMLRLEMWKLSTSPHRME